MSYYILERVVLESTPAIAIKTGALKIVKCAPMEDDAVVSLAVAGDDKAAYSLGDFQAIPDPVISPRVVDILSAFDLPDTQYLSTTLVVGKKTVTTHKFVYCLNILDAVDLDASDYSTFPDGEVNRFKSLRLREDYLDNEVPEEKRRFFRLKHLNIRYVVNQAVADALNAADIADLRVIPVEKWKSAMNLNPRRLKKFGLQ